DFTPAAMSCRFALNAEPVNGPILGQGLIEIEKILMLAIEQKPDIPALPVLRDFDGDLREHVLPQSLQSNPKG
ncbi:hypothetical protein, partial [Acinetobacter baumannii]